MPQLGAALSALANVQWPWTFLNQSQLQQCTLSTLSSGLPAQQRQQRQQQCSNSAAAVSLVQQQQQPHLPRLQHRLHGFHTSAAMHEKQLKDIMKLDRLQHETADNVEEVWMAVRNASP